MQLPRPEWREDGIAGPAGGSQPVARTPALVSIIFAYSASRENALNLKCSEGSRSVRLRTFGHDESRGLTSRPPFSTEAFR